MVYGYRQELRKEEPKKPQVNLHEMAARGFNQANEDHKKTCQGFIEKCTEIARKVKKKSEGLIGNESAIVSFEDKQTMKKFIEGIKQEYKENKKIAFAKLKLVNGRDFREAVDEHFKELDDIMQIPKDEKPFPSSLPNSEKEKKKD